MRARPFVLTAVAIVSLMPRPAAATFHLMQIEQIIGGVNGNTGAQAIQLRMRSSLQNQMQNANLVVRDATGSNPITLIAFPSAVSMSAAGARVLVATPSFT